MARPFPTIMMASLAGALLATPATAENLTGRGAVLQAMDKVTARISKIEAPVGEVVRYGELEIHVKSCRKRPPEEPPETFVFVEIDEIKRGETPVRLFGGWMFASSPALSALEHPVYDIWIVDCIKDASSASSTSQ